MSAPRDTLSNSTDALKRSNSTSSTVPQRSSKPRPTDIPSIFATNQIPSAHPSPTGAHATNPAIASLRARPQKLDGPTSDSNRAANKPRSLSTSDPSGPMLSPEATDRVFPIRSYVTVTPSPTTRDAYFPTSAAARRTASRQSSSGLTAHLENVGEITGENLSGTESDATVTPAPDAHLSADPMSLHSPTEKPAANPFKARKTVNGVEVENKNNVRASGQGYQITSDADSIRSGSTRRDESSVHEAGVPGGPRSNRPPSQNSFRSTRDQEDPGGFLTARFKHVITEGGHAVITGRDGETLQRCEDEPIHIPGAVQSFGALVALEEQPDGKLMVRVASENSKRIIGYTPKHLFRLDSFTDILSEDQTDNLADHIDFIREGEDDVEANGPEVFTMTIRNSQRKAIKLWAAIHINERNPNLIICEFELEEDPLYPLTPVNEETPEPPEDTLDSTPTEEEYRESTETKSRPLRVLRSARKRKGEAAAMEVFNIMSQVQEQLGEAPNLDAFLKVLVGVVKELTGFHRVMIYQFDASWNGKVVTELVDPRATKDLYKGLHFPASDIPKQARDLYKVNKVRLLYDRDQETSRLVCRTVEDLETPLDLTHSYLRAMSPIHIKYLHNMAVRSSMSISINAFNELWGLISCHCYGGKGTRVSFPIRKMCRLVGDSASRNIERLSYASRLQARKLINTAPTKKNPSGYIIASSDDLLRLFDADFGLLSINEETKILGKLEGSQEALALLEYLRVRCFGSVVTSQDVRFDFPDLQYPPGFKSVAGLLLVPLSSAGHDFIVFFRRGQLREVKWAGNPYEKYVKEGTEGYLEPRKSFKTWSETVVGKCREWTEEEVETAAVLCLVYGKFIEVWRQKEAALQNSQLTKLLLANSAHEVRTPLNAIINYLEIAMEGALDEETRENLSRSHSASKSLIYVINDLLDLTKTEAGGELVHEEPFDLRKTFLEAADMFQGDARRKEIGYNVTLHDNVPQSALGDQRRVHRAISNIIANAVQATSSGQVDVEMLVATQYDHLRIDVEVIVTDTGVGMNSEKLDALFAELEQVQAEHASLIEDAIAPDAKSLTDGKEEKQALGLGLAIVARIVRNMNGQLRLKSEENKGSRFVLQLPFALPEEMRPSVKIKESIVDPFESQHEVTLVAKNLDDSSSVSSGNRSAKPPSRKGSTESMRSFGSANSAKSKAMSIQSSKSGASGRSDVDRLIEAMQEPILVNSQPQSPSVRQDTLSSRRPAGLKEGLERSPHSHDGVINSKVPAHRRSSRTELTRAGFFEVVDSGQPGRAVRVPDDDLSASTAPAETMSKDGDTESQKSSLDVAQHITSEKMHVLIAEDDPINAKIIQKRLGKVEHTTYLTVNGEECASIFCERPGTFDVILMDMQMPIVDGLTSAKMIRSFEKANPDAARSPRAVINGRIPIIAVSASLVEKERDVYADGGFDGWILKPINFNRLAEIMHGIVNHNVRQKNVYTAGEWERGGWFHPAQQTADEATTKPDPEQDVSTSGERVADERPPGASERTSSSETVTASKAAVAKEDDSKESQESIKETEREMETS